jgi:glutaminase
LATESGKRERTRRETKSTQEGVGTLVAPATSSSSDATYRRLFNSLDRDGDGSVSAWEMLAALQDAGIKPDDPRIQDALSGLTDSNGQSKSANFSQFVSIARRNSGLVKKAVEGRLVVPDFSSMAADLEDIYQKLLPVTDGAVADYIPQLRRVDPDQLAIAVCTVDGQRFATGDSRTVFCLQSVSKTVNYCLALDEHGPDIVHRHVGREPSGHGFNDLSFNSIGLPHNPMINAGAIMSTSLIKPALDIADRFDAVAATWQRLSAGRRVGFNNAVYLSERQTADRNFALGYSMRERGAFPKGTNLLETLEFYFQCCSIEVDAEMLAIAAASLANSGVCPLTEDRVFTPRTAQHCLSLMSSCGMYDFSGEFAFTIGLPAKSGVSGALMVVIPHLMGICVWSPRLDKHGNSVRGIEFCRKLVEMYNVHVYDSLVSGAESNKRDPRLKKNHETIQGVIELCWAASQGDLDEIRRLVAIGQDLNASDYDGRTALHLAAAEGQTHVIEYLLGAGVNPAPVDRWGGTPLADAERNDHNEAAALLQSYSDQPKINNSRQGEVA